MRIDIIFDTICPWCYIGTKRLLRALSLRRDIPATLVWRPFFLNPDIPESGLPRSSYLERKYGGPARVERILNGLRDAGASEGIAFDFDSILVTPSSRLSHALICCAAHQNRAVEVVMRIFESYFCRGRNIGMPSVLLDIARQEGLEIQRLREDLLSEHVSREVEAENAQSHHLNLNGIPCFVFNGRYAIAGAQEPDVLLRMIDLAAEESPLADPCAQARSWADGWMKV